MISEIRWKERARFDNSIKKIKNMKLKYSNALVLLSILLIGIDPFSTEAQDSKAVNQIKIGSDGVIYLEDFQHYKTGTIPDEWYNRDGDAIPALYDDDIKDEYTYKVMREGSNKYLRFEGTGAKHLNFPLLDKEINIHETPILKWKWRIHSTPVGGDESSNNSNDSAASVYMVMDTGRVLFQTVPKSIRYTWSSTLPKGKEISRFFGNQKIIVLGTGNEHNGEWMTFERNVVEDYKRLFGEIPPEQPIAMLILSSGNSTNSLAKADYDDFELHPVKNSASAN